MMEKQKPDLERAPTSDGANGDRVEFDGPDDTYNPQNWSFSKKTLTTFLYGLTTLGSTWASAAYSPANKTVARDYNVSNEIAVLGTSVLLLGCVDLPSQ
jgi:DHA1 family multidrug resistance protein-like MFS transporter